MLCPSVRELLQWLLHLQSSSFLFGSSCASARLLFLPVGRRSALRPLPRRAMRLHEIERGIDESDVRKALREVADQAPRVQVVFLGQKTEIVAKLQQPLEERARFIEPAEHHIDIGKPKRARDERAFRARGPRCLSSSAARGRRASAPLRWRLRYRSRAGRSRARSRPAESAAEPRRGPGLRNIARSCGAARRTRARECLRVSARGISPAIDRTVELEPLAALHRAVERDPAHQARVREVALGPRVSQIRVIGLLPHAFQVLEQHLLQAPGFVERDSTAPRAPRAARP